MTTKCVCLFLTILVASAAIGQDSAWKRVSITTDVSVFMPGSTISLDSTQVQAINAQLDGYVFQLKQIKIKYIVNNGDELILGYDNFIKGYMSTFIRLYKNTVSDTSFMGTLGEWIHSKYSKDTIFSEMYSYLVLVNSYFYMVTLAANHPINDTMLHRYFATLQFPTQPIKEHSGDFPLRARSFRNGQHIGLFIRTYYIYGVAFGIFTLIFVLLFRNIRRKRKIKSILGQ
jgi:hypothetical protein